MQCQCHEHSVRFLGGVLVFRPITSTVGRPTYSRENSSRSSKLDRFDLGQCSNIAYRSRFSKCIRLLLLLLRLLSLSLPLSSRVNISCSSSSRDTSRPVRSNRKERIEAFLRYFPILETFDVRAFCTGSSGSERIEDEERGSGCEIVSKRVNSVGKAPPSGRLFLRRTDRVKKERCGGLDMIQRFRDEARERGR